MDEMIKSFNKTAAEMNIAAKDKITILGMITAMGYKYEQTARNFRDCRNELCLRCGDYKNRHLGACDGCRWREQ
jgi:hypothetical protein